MLIEFEVIRYEKQLTHFQGVIDLMAADINLRDSKETQLQNMVIELLELLQDSGDQSSASDYKKKLDKLNGIFSEESSTGE